MVGSMFVLYTILKQIVLVARIVQISREAL